MTREGIGGYFRMLEIERVNLKLRLSSSASKLGPFILELKERRTKSDLQTKGLKEQSLLS